MKNLITIVLISLLSPLIMVGQPNLVPNPSFEDTIGCPGDYSQVDNKCKYWDEYHGSPDYFHNCTNFSMISVPSNRNGYQVAFGNAYAGIAALTTSTNPNFEYLTTPIRPLQLGSRYEVTIHVNLADAVKYAVNSIGVLFFDSGATFIPGSHFLTQTPQIHYSNNGIISDKVNWVKLTSYFVADSTYDNIVIGPFNNTSNSYSIDTLTSGSEMSFYYIDSVLVRKADSLLLDNRDSIFCAGDTIIIPYTAIGSYNSNNLFIVQLSDTSGNFTTPTNVGTKTSILSGTITCTIPLNTPTSDNYRMRIISSNIADTGSDNGYRIKIGGAPFSKPVINSNSPLCASDTLKLTVASNSTVIEWNWSGPNNFSSNIANPIIPNATNTINGAYIVTASTYGCNSRDTEFVAVNYPPSNAIATGNTPICANDTLKLLGIADGNGNSYAWTGPNNFVANQQNPILPMVSTSYTGDYVLQVSNGNCTSKDTVTMLVKPIPATFIATYNGPICTGDAINFTASSTSTGVTYAWTGPNSFNSTSATPFIGGSSPIHNGDYIITATLNGCSLKDTVTVNVKPLPAKPASNSNAPLCAGQTLNLTANTSTSGVNWNWTGPGNYTSTTQNPNITSATTAISGDYIVTTDLNGCNRKDTTTVLVKPLPMPVTTSSNTPLCAGDTLKIFSTASSTGVSYIWNGPVSFTSTVKDTIIANTTSSISGWYKMTVELNGCIYKDSTNVIVHPIPAIPIVSYGNPVCIGEALHLNANSTTGANYSWSGPNNFSSVQQNPTRINMQFGDTGTYAVATIVNGCTSPQGVITVKINTLPFVVILANPADSVCQGEAVLFTAYPNNHGGTPQYQWLVNGIASGTGTVFSTSALNHQDIVRCDMTENTKCSVPYKDESNDVTMNVLPWLAPMVSISANPAHPLDAHEYVTFTAVTTNAGNNPAFQWKRNGQNIVGATGSVWSVNTLNDNDSIAVAIISDYKCPQPTTASSNWIRIKMTGLGEVIKNGAMVVYPNPNKGKFVLEAPFYPKEQEHLNLEVINTLGQVVYSDKIISTNGNLRKEIDLGNIANGVYLLRLYTNTGVSVARFTVQ